MSSAAVSRGDDPAALEPAEDQRTDAVRVAGGVQGVLVHEDEAEGAAQPRQHVERRRLEGAVGVVGEQRRDQGGVGGVAAGRARRGAASSPRRPSTRSRSSAVLMRLPLWASATVPPAWPPSVGWAFSQVRAAGGGVAAVADREVAAQRRERALVEDLGDQAHVLVDEDLLAVGGRDAGRLLPAVLQRVEAEVGELGDVLAGGPDAEDAAGVLRPLLAGEQVVGEASVSACHDVDSPTPAGQDRSAAPVQQHREDGGEQRRRRRRRCRGRPTAAPSP